MELNKHSFLIYFKEGIISIYNSKTNKEIEKLIRINNNKTDNDFKRMIKINEGNILLLYKKGLLIYNILLKKVSNIFTVDYELINVYKIPNYNDIFITNYLEHKKFGLIPLYLDSFIQQFKFGEIIRNIHNNEITCFKILNNGDLVTGSLDKYMKIWKIKKKNKNNI